MLFNFVREVHIYIYLEPKWPLFCLKRALFWRVDRWPSKIEVIWALGIYIICTYLPWEPTTFIIRCSKFPVWPWHLKPPANHLIGIQIFATGTANDRQSPFDKLWKYLDTIWCWLSRLYLLMQEVQHHHRYSFVTSTGTAPPESFITLLVVCRNNFQGTSCCHFQKLCCHSSAVDPYAIMAS